MILGGSALYVAGHAAFQAAVWRVLPRTRLMAIAVLALLGLLAAHVAALVLGALADAVLVGLAVADRTLSGRAPAADRRPGRPDPRLRS